MKPASCEILGPFSLIIQGLLGVLALSSLVWKRFHEYPNRRPWKIWFFDVSKQVIGAAGVHVLNLTMSIVGGNAQRWAVNDTTTPYYLQSDGPRRKPPEDVCDNPCDYYFLNILFDTTVGIGILWGMLYVLNGLAKRAHVTGIDSGEYGDPPKTEWYFKQLGIYYMGLVGMKLIVYTLLILCPVLVRFAVWILSWSDALPNLQVAFVMMIFPLLMNTFQYYVIDNIIQSPEYYKANKEIRKQLEGHQQRSDEETQSSSADSTTETLLESDSNRQLNNNNINIDDSSASTKPSDSSLASTFNSSTLTATSLPPK